MLALLASEDGDTKLSPSVEAPIPIQTSVATRWPCPPPGCNPQVPSCLDTACELHWAIGDTTRLTLSAGPWYRDDSTRTTERTLSDLRLMFVQL